MQYLNYCTQLKFGEAYLSEKKTYNPYQKTKQVLFLGAYFELNNIVSRGQVSTYFS